MLFDYWLSITLSGWVLSYFAYSPVWSCSDYRCNHQTFVVTKQLSHKTFDFIPLRRGSIIWLFAPIHNISNVTLACPPNTNEGEEAKILVSFLILFQSFFLTFSLLSKSPCDGCLGLRSISVSSARCRVRIPPVLDILLMFSIKSEMLKLFQAYKISGYEFIIYCISIYDSMVAPSLPSPTPSPGLAGPPSSQGIGNDTFYNICFFQRN